MLMEIAVSVNFIECSTCDRCQTDKSAIRCFHVPFMFAIVFIFVNKWAVAGSLVEGHLVCYGYVCVFVCECACNTSC